MPLQSVFMFPNLGEVNDKCETLNISEDLSARHFMMSEMTMRDEKENKATGIREVKETVKNPMLKPENQHFKAQYLKSAMHA